MLSIPFILELEKELKLLGATEAEKDYIIQNTHFCTHVEVKNIAKYARNRLEIFRKH